MKTTTDYNGWKNRQTWNVSLHINNDYSMYCAAKDYMKSNPESKKPYASFIRDMGMQHDTTLDRIKWISTRLDYPALNDMMRELIAD